MFTFKVTNTFDYIKAQTLNINWKKFIKKKLN